MSPKVITPQPPTLNIVKETDLRSITRDSARLRTDVILLEDPDGCRQIRWLMAGESRLTRNDHLNIWLLEAHLGGGATDPEHDTAYAFRLPLIGLTFEMVAWHDARFSAWVDPNVGAEEVGGSFHVPWPGYDPAKAPGAVVCKSKSCHKRHVIVPEGLYVPPFDPALYEAVRGKRVAIHIGPVALED